MQTINDKHIDWVDGAKGIAILSVFLLHSLPCLNEIGSYLHIGQAVPVFLFITTYLISIRFDTLRTYFASSRWKKMIRNIVVPFLIVLLIQIICLAIADRLPSWKSILKVGGIGLGSYYIWLYLQVWIMTPFIVLLTRKVPIWASLIIMMSIAILSEYLFVQIWDIGGVRNIYDLSPIRYLMVLYLGCVWAELKDTYKWGFMALACISGLLLLADTHFANNQLLANVCMGGGKIIPSTWVGYHWHTAFYVLIPISVLEKIHYADMLKDAGKYSWYLFLLQMMCFGFYY